MRSFKMFKRNISFREKKRKKLLQKSELCSKEKVHIMNFLNKGKLVERSA